MSKTRLSYKQSQKCVVELHTVVSYKPREILYVAHTMFDFAGCSSPLDLDLACSLPSPLPVTTSDPVTVRLHRYHLGRRAGNSGNRARRRAQGGPQARPAHASGCLRRCGPPRGLAATETESSWTAVTTDATGQPWAGAAARARGSGGCHGAGGTSWVQRRGHG